MEQVRVNETQVIWAHDSSQCAQDSVCSIHNPSAAAEAIGVRHWRNDRKMMERICTHGIGHPDPDQVSYWKSVGLDTFTLGVHGCDGCCLMEDDKEDVAVLGYTVG